VTPDEPSKAGVWVVLVIILFVVLIAVALYLLFFPRDKTNGPLERKAEPKSAGLNPVKGEDPSLGPKPQDMGENYIDDNPELDAPKGEPIDDKEDSAEIEEE